MSPKSHTRKVTGKATGKKSESPFRCEQCGKTFISESEQRKHETSEHAREQGKEQQGKQSE